MTTAPRRFSPLAWAVAGCVVIASAVIPPTLLPDSSSYIDGSIMRPPLIPLVLKALALLGPGLSLRAFSMLQTGLAVASLVLLVSEMGDRLGMRPWARWTVGIVLAIPQLKSATTVASESTAYSFLCLALAFAIPLLWGDRRRRWLVLVAASCAAASATRGQFIYLAPLCVLGAVAFVYREASWRERGKTVGLLALVPLVVLALQALQTIPQVHRFARVAVTGLQTMTITSCLATDADVEAIEDPTVRAFAQRVRARVRANGHLMEQRGGTAPPIFLADHYNAILDPIYDEYFEGEAHLPPVAPENRLKVDADVHIAMDKMTLAASKGIFRHAWKRIIVFCASSVFLWDRYTVVLAAGLLALGLREHRRRPSLAALVVLVAGLWFVNAGLVAALEPPQTRYTFYFDELVVAVALALVACALDAAPVAGSAAPDAAKETS